MKESIGVGYYRLNIPSGENQPNVDRTEVNRIVADFTRRFGAAVTSAAGESSTSVNRFVDTRNIVSQK